MKRYKEGTLVFHKKRKVFGKMETGYSRKALRENDRIFRVLQEIEPNKYNSYASSWFNSNLIILTEDSPQHRLAVQLKYSG